MLDWMLSATLNALPSETAPLVITGAHHPAIEGFIERARARETNPLPSEIAFNPRWEAGRTAGLQLAARLRVGADLLIWPADVPLVSASCLKELVQEWERLGSPNRGWLAPAVGKKFGHPMVVGRALVSELDGLQPDAPLRELRKRADPLSYIRVEDAAVLDDLDTPADLDRLRRRVDEQAC